MPLRTRIELVQRDDATVLTQSTQSTQSPRAAGSTSPAQLQAALTTAGGDNADVANAFLPVAFNVAIFFAGIVGAALLTVADGLVLPVLMIGFGVVAFALTVYGRRNAFPGSL